MWNNEINLEVEEGTRITAAPLSQIKKIVNKIEAFCEEQNVEEDTMLVPFEYVIGSLFPNSYSAMKEMMLNQYREGFNDGREGIEK